MLKFINNIEYTNKSFSLEIILSQKMFISFIYF